MLRQRAKKFTTNLKTMFKSHTLLFILFLLLVQGVQAMSFSETFPNDFCIFSNMQGTITLHGKPAAGAKLVLQLYYYNEKQELIETVADAAGRFHFSSVWKKLGMKRFSLAETVATQDIIAYYQGEEYDVWSHGKHALEEFSELNGVPVNFRCELSDKYIAIKLVPYTGSTAGICKWDSIQKNDIQTKEKN